MKETSLVIDNSALLTALGLEGKINQDLVWTYINSAENIYAPSLIKYEFLNCIRKFDSSNLQNLINAYNMLDIITIDDVNMESISAISLKHNLTGYDASYYSLLDRLKEDSVLITFDQDFAKVKDKRIKLLIFT